MYEHDMKLLLASLKVLTVSLTAFVFVPQLSGDFARNVSVSFCDQYHKLSVMCFPFELVY